MNKIEPTLGDAESALKNDSFVNPPFGDLDDVCISSKHRTQEKEGITPQDEKTFRSFVIACVVTGLVIGIIIVAIFS